MLYQLGPGGILVEIYRTSPSDQEWSGLLSYMLQHRERINGVLAIAHNNAGPSSSQREALAQVLKLFPKSMPFALLTGSRVARGVMTAINWLTGRAHVTAVFPPEELQLALHFFKLDGDEQAALQQFIAQLDPNAQPIAQSS